MSKIKIGHYQRECVPGDIKENTKRLFSCLEEAQRENIEILSLPESFLTGYFTDPEKAEQFSLNLNSSPTIDEVLKESEKYSMTFMVGLNEKREKNLYNTVIVVEQGKLRGLYSKAFPCYNYFTPGRDFPVFEKNGVKFGIVICADGGYIEPCRILALKGAQVIFAPHYNYIQGEKLLEHFQRVRSDHTARATENGIWFLRGNSVTQGYDQGIDTEGIGYGDSYLLDPCGEMVMRSQRHRDQLISAVIDISPEAPVVRRSLTSLLELGEIASKEVSKLI